MGGVFWLLLVGILATPIAMWSSVSTYVVPGGRAQLQVNSDGLRLESSARIQLFPLSDLRIHITEHRAQFRIFAVPAGTVQTDVHLRLSAGSEGLILSRRLFEDPDRMDALLADLERLRAGEPPLGVSHAREAAERASVDPETAKLEARLDAEIDAADS